ncbi:MAG: hypothetical protein RLZ25_1696 [Pseudomonadota bacterium]|jgi:uncharacterized protein YaiL (DUF2058 family)
MAGLRDQLLKSGLVTEKQVKKVQKEQVKATKANAHRPAPPTVDTAPRHQEKIERDRLLNQQRQAELARRDLEAQIRDLITTRRILPEAGDTPFNFTDGTKVKKLYLTSSMRDQLVRGVIGIVHFEGGHAFVPRETIEKIRLRDEEVILLLNDLKGEPTETQNDPYAQYQVPDDLIW